MGYLTKDSSEGINHCLACGDIIEYGLGRQDRKFCSPGCKNRYHNKRRAQSWERYQQKIQKTLEDNHKILSKLLQLGLTSIDLVSLGRLGYNFNYVTSYHKIGRRSLYSCYDITYEATPSRILHLESHWDSGSGLETEEGAVSVPEELKQRGCAVSGDL